MPSGQGQGRVSQGCSRTASGARHALACSRATAAAWMMRTKITAEVTAQVTLDAPNRLHLRLRCVRHECSLRKLQRLQTEYIQWQSTCHPMTLLSIELVAKSPNALFVHQRKREGIVSPFNVGVKRHVCWPVDTACSSVGVALSPE